MTKPRCNNHKDAPELPRLCHTCQRIAVEHDIVTKTVDALLAAGYALAENETLQEDSNPTPMSREALLDLLFDLDDAYLVVLNTITNADDSTTIDYDRPVGWVRFVFGNDGYDVISDYSVNLEDVLKPINDYADTLAN